MCVRKDARQIVRAERGAGDDLKMIGREPRNCAITFDAAARIQHLRICHAPNRFIHFICAQILQRFQRARTAHKNFAERSFVKQSRAFARANVFDADVGRPVMARPSARSGKQGAGVGTYVAKPRSLTPIPRALKPIRSFPTRLFAKHRAEFLQTRVGGRDSQWARGRAFFIRIMNVVIFSVRFNRARENVILARVIRAETPMVEPPQIPFGMPLDNPFRHRLADAARARETVRAKRGGNPKPFHRRRTEQIFRVGRESFGTIEQ